MSIRTTSSTDTRTKRKFRHDFVVEPLAKSFLFDKPGEVYACIRCRWSFAVSGRKFVALDESGRALNGREGSERAITFAEGPCPALAILEDQGVRKDPEPVARPVRPVLSVVRSRI